MDKIEYCQNHGHCYANYVPVKEGGRFISVPLCLIVAKECRFKGQQVQETYICDMALAEERRKTGNPICEDNEIG